MATFSQGFIRPGVYIKQTTGAGAAQLPTPFSAAFIGHGSDRFTIESKLIISDGEATQVLDSERPVMSITKVVINNADVASARYAIANIGTEPFGSANIVWDEEEGDIPAEGSKYYVTYIAYKNPSVDYKVQRFTKIEDHLAFYGAPSISASNVLNGVNIENNLSLAAYIGVQQGMGEWYGMQLNPYDETTFGGTPASLDLTSEAGLKTATEQALAKLLLVNAYAIVPLFPMVESIVNDSIITSFIAHVDFARSIAEQKWRVAIIGAQKNTDSGTNPEDKYIASAQSFTNKAIAYVAPGTSKFIYGGVEFVLDGYGYASGVAGIVANGRYDAGEPIAGKTLIGFSDVEDPFTNTQKTFMGTAGLLMIDYEFGNPAIIMDLTTDQSNAVNSQVKFIRSADYVSKSLRSILRQLYVNTRNVGEATLSNISSSAKMILQQMAWLNIINDFEIKTVEKNAIDARQVDVAIDIQLVPDVTWIYINLGVSL